MVGAGADWVHVDVMVSVGSAEFCGLHIIQVEDLENIEGDHSIQYNFWLKNCEIMQDGRFVPSKSCAYV